jgi:recombination protein RecA
VAEFDIMYNEGISKAGGLLDIGVEMGLIDKRGSYYSYGEQRIGQGRENAKNYLQEHPELSAELEAGIRDSAGLDPAHEDPGDGGAVEQDVESELLSAELGA